MIRNSYLCEGGGFPLSPELRRQKDPAHLFRHPLRGDPATPPLKSRSARSALIWKPLDDAKLQELAQSIRTNGLIQPISLEPEADATQSEQAFSPPLYLFGRLTTPPESRPFSPRVKSSGFESPISADCTIKP